MPSPHIWDEAFELLEQCNLSKSGSSEDEAFESLDQCDVNKSESSEYEVFESLDQCNLNKSGSSEKEIAFREITDETPPASLPDDPDNPHESDVSFKNTDIPYELHESEVSLRTADVQDDLDENKGSMKPDGGTNDLVTIDLETIDFEDGRSTKSAKELFYETQNNLFKIFHLIKDDEDFSIETVVTYASDMVSHIREKANSWMQLLYKIEKDTPSDAVIHIVKHSLDTAIIAIRVGIGLKLRDDSLESLATQSCLHDVGMLKLPTGIIKQGKLSRKEKDLIKKHPEYGYEILRKYTGKYKDIAEVTYHVHERYDGSGYPRGIKGKDIPENSLIIGIADMFAALLHPRPYRSRRLPFEAIKEIIASAKEQFPKHIIKALVNEFSAFPEGLYVKLNSNEIGKVITVNRLAPLSPIVEILYNGQGKLKNPKIVDLMKDHCLYIVSGFYGEEE
jgi:HD-GYP domain-containing protein (c-di-GMP phosphodiesterase class II)